MKDGVGRFLLGVFIAGLAVYLLVDSSRIVTGGGWLLGGRRGFGTTGNFAIILIPILVGLVWVFLNTRSWLAWTLVLGGAAIFLLELISGLRFHMNMKTSWFIILLVMFAAGLATTISGYMQFRKYNALYGDGPSRH